MQLLAPSLAFLALAGLSTAAPTKSPKARQAAAITDIHVFGDSYSDSCNNLRQTASLLTPAYPACPPPPMGRGDGGRSWPEFVRIDTGETEAPNSGLFYTGPPGGLPKNSSQWNINVWAFAGATCDNAIFPRSGTPDINDQITLMTTDYNRKAAYKTLPTNPASTVAILWVGTNDAAFSLLGKGTVAQEVTCVKTRLQRLHDLGFRRFVVINNINLQDTPFLNTPQYHDAAQAFVTQNNADQAAQLPGAFPDSTVDIFPAYDLFKAMHDRPADFGFTNVQSTCGPICFNEDQYLWHDSVHPTQRAFHIFSRKLTRFLRGDRSNLTTGTEGL